jgi:hypothetical protein
MEEAQRALPRPTFNELVRGMFLVLLDHLTTISAATAQKPASVIQAVQMHCLTAV